MLAAFFVANTLGHFNLSNTLGHGMVLQRAPQQAVVWGFGEPGVKINTSLGGATLGATIDETGLWRISLPATPAATTGATLTFHGSEGTTLTLDDVLFGDVFLCAGQSNMQYTPRSMAGMNNMSAEVAAADRYGATLRFFTVGMGTSCGSDAAKGQTDCSRPFREL